MASWLCRNVKDDANCSSNYAFRKYSKLWTGHIRCDLIVYLEAHSICGTSKYYGILCSVP